MHPTRQAFRRWRQSAVLAAGFAVVVAGVHAETVFAQGKENEVKLFEKAQATFGALPKDAATKEFPVTPERASLGRMLFFDPRISSDGVGSCVRCHQPALYGADALPQSRGINGKVLFRNAPTVLNAGLHVAAHWDGIFENVESQAIQSLIGPGFGNRDHAVAMSRLKEIPGYAPLFEKAFPGESDPVNEANWGKAIGAYERTLMTPALFDDYLGGNIDALSAAERKGLKRFMEIGCAQCHDGAAVGGNGFEKFGIKGDYWKETISREIDRGRAVLTKNAEDTYHFKVAGLRNVTMTAPYFHDGSVTTLPEAVRIMAKLQLGKELKEQEVAEIVTFLGTLTGKLPADFINAPVLPAAAYRPIQSAVRKISAEEEAKD